MNKAFLFPGQGSQSIGMGKDFFDNFKIAKDVFNEVDEALKFKLSTVIFEGPIEVLTQTQNTQPALMATSMAILKVIENELGLKCSKIANVLAGHSLGQYTALCAAESMSISQTAIILKARGEYMQNACPEGVGAMAAVIGSDQAKLKEIIKISAQKGICEIANDNSDEQVVISGELSAVNYACDLFKEAGIKAIMLKVSAPFHSSLMHNAALNMKNLLESQNILAPTINVIDNVTVSCVNNPEEIKNCLIKQVDGTVRWRESMKQIADESNYVLEIGSGKVLSSMFKRSYPEARVKNISKVDDLADVLNDLK